VIPREVDYYVDSRPPFAVPGPFWIFCHPHSLKNSYCVTFPRLTLVFFPQKKSSLSRPLGSPCSPWAQYHHINRRYYCSLPPTTTVFGQLVEIVTNHFLEDPLPILMPSRAAPCFSLDTRRLSFGVRSLKEHVQLDSSKNFLIATPFFHGVEPWCCCPQAVLWNGRHTSPLGFFTTSSRTAPCCAFRADRLPGRDLAIVV